MSGIRGVGAKGDENSQRWKAKEVRNGEHVKFEPTLKIP